MPVIKARTRGKHIVRYITRLDRENVETLFAYAAFLGEPTEYVLNQLVETVLGKDKDFQTWREQNPGPHVPRPGERSRAKSGAVSRPTAATASRPASTAATA